MKKLITIIIITQVLLLFQIGISIFLQIQITEMKIGISCLESPAPLQTKEFHQLCLDYYKKQRGEL